jgi:hypothetical protein
MMTPTNTGMSGSEPRPFGRERRERRGDSCI